MTTKMTDKVLGILFCAGIVQAVPPEIQALSDWEMDEDSFLSVPVVITDADSPVLSYWADVEDTHVRVSFDEANMLVHVNPQPNWNGATLVMVGVEDGDGSRTVDVETFMVTVLPVNDCPLSMAQPASLQTFEDQALLLGYPQMHALFTDPDWQWGGDELLFNQAAYSLGTVEGVGDAFLLHTAPDVNGIGVLSFVADDGECQVEVSLEVLVQPLNDSPVQVLAWNPVAGVEDQVLEIPGLAEAFTDVEEQELSVGLSDDEAAFSAQWDAATGTLLLTPPADVHGEVALELSVSDGHSSTSAILHLTLAAVNDAPAIALVEDQQMPEDASLLLEVDVSDVDADSLSLSARCDQAGLDLWWEDDGRLRLQPLTNWNGLAQVTLSVDDGQGRTVAERQFQVTVTPVNDLPWAQPCGDWSCGPVEDEAAFRTALLTGEMRLDLADADQETLTLSWFINGQLASTHQLETGPDTLRCLSLPAPPVELLDGSILLHAEVADGAGSLNPAGAACAWELDFTGMASVQPLRFALGPGQPIPFNPSTHLPFVLDEAGPARLAIYNLQGALVEVLHDGWLPAGAHTQEWRAEGRASGIYLAVLESASRTLSTRLTLIK